MASRDRRFPLFDAMRALAALSIFAYHCAHQLHGFSGPAGRYLAQLNIGVPVFFLISGFLLYRPFVRARRDHDRRPSLRAYAVRRAARIVPTYWVALPIIAVWLGLSAQVFTPEGVLTYFGFGQLYRSRTLPLLGVHELRLAAAACILAPALGVTARPHPFQRALGWRPLLWVGQVSYGLYLWHLVMVRKLDDAGLPQAIGRPTYIAAALA